MTMTTTTAMTMKAMMSDEKSLYKKHNKQETKFLKFKSNSSINYTRNNIKNNKQKYTPLRHVRKLRW